MIKNIVPEDISEEDFEYPPFPGRERLKGSQLLWYAKTSNLRELESELLADPSDLNCKDVTGMTALHWAAANRNYAMCAFLLKQEGIDLSVADNRGHTALEHAVSSGDEKVIKILMSASYGED